ncbi:MAG: hypothetical protein LN566_05785 [Rickettsia endosymbiont of Stiretrus anchorago]|nr:hypothetical protein [Rickettsia endosymbiont of Stiretrus anchorago]
MFNWLQTPQKTTTKAPPTPKIVQAKIPSSQKVELTKTPNEKLIEFLEKRELKTQANNLRKDATRLYLSSNDIGEAGATELARVLKDNSTLTSLDLGNNNTGKLILKTIGEYLERNKTIAVKKAESLNAEGNNLCTQKKYSEAIEKYKSAIKIKKALERYNYTKENLYEKNKEKAEKKYEEQQQALKLQQVALATNKNKLEDIKDLAKEADKQDQTQANLPASEENLYKVLQKMLEIQKLVENTADLYTHPISESIKEVINRDQITNDMLINLAGKLDKVLEEQTIINDHSCKEKLFIFTKIAIDITIKLDEDKSISSNNKAIMQNVMNKIIDRVANLTNIFLIEKITTSIIELKTGKITKGRLSDLEEEIEELILEQTNKEANMMLTWSVKEIVYDKPLLNHPKLLELALSKFSLQEIAELRALSK